MDLTFDTLDGHTMEFSTDGAKLVRTGVAYNVPAAVRSDPLMMLRAFEGVIRRISPSYPNVIGSRITKVTLRPAKGTNQAQFAVTYEGPPQFPNKPQSRWVIEDDSTLATEKTELDLTGDVLMVKYQPPGKQAAPPPGVGAGGTPIFFSGGQAFDPVYHSEAASVLRPRRKISINGWIIGRPGDKARQAQDCVNAEPIFGLAMGYWLCSRVYAKVENPGNTPFPEQTMIYHVGADFLSKVLYDWSNLLLFKDKFGVVPKELSTDPKNVAERQKILKAAYSIKQNRGNGFTKVGLYYLNEFAGTFGL